MRVGQEGVIGLFRVDHLLGEEDLGQRLRVDPDKEGVPVAGIQQGDHQQRHEEQAEDGDGDNDAWRGEEGAEVYRLRAIEDEVVGEAAHLHVHLVLHVGAAVLDEVVQLLEE